MVVCGGGAASWNCRHDRQRGSGGRERPSWRSLESFPGWVGRIPDEEKFNVAKAWGRTSWMPQKQGGDLGLGGCVSTGDKTWGDSLISFCPAGMKHRSRLYSRGFPADPQGEPRQPGGDRWHPVTM